MRAILLTLAACCLMAAPARSGQFSTIIAVAVDVTTQAQATIVGHPIRAAILPQQSGDVVCVNGKCRRLVILSSKPSLAATCNGACPCGPACTCSPTCECPVASADNATTEYVPVPVPPQRSIVVGQRPKTERFLPRLRALPRKVVVHTAMRVQARRSTRGHLLRRPLLDGFHPMRRFRRCH